MVQNNMCHPDPHLAYFLSSSLSVVQFIYILFHLLCKLAEQYTKEQQDTDVIGRETLDLDTNFPESTVEITQSKDSLPLSLIGVSETIVQDFSPDDFPLEATVEPTGIIEVKYDSKKSTTAITVPG